MSKPVRCSVLMIALFIVSLAETIRCWGIKTSGKYDLGGTPADNYVLAVLSSVYFDLTGLVDS